MAVPQALADCTAIFTVYIVKHRPLPCVVTIHETSTDQQWKGILLQMIVYVAVTYQDINNETHSFLSLKVV